MTTIDFEPLTVAVPLREDPPGVFRVEQSRVLLELVLRAFQRGESAEGIVRSFPTLKLADVYAVIGRYLANPAPFDDYLRLCEEQVNEICRQIETVQGLGVSKDLANPRVELDLLLLGSGGSRRNCVPEQPIRVYL